MKPITDGLSPEQIGSLRFLSEGRVLPAGSLVYGEGDPAEGFYQVLAGEVELVARDSKGQDVTILRAGDGEIFGFAGALQGSSRRLATARAVRTTSIIGIPVNPVPVFAKAFGPGPACVLMGNIIREACGSLCRVLEQPEELPQVAPQAPIPGDPAGTPEDWLRRIGEAMPTGLAARIFGGKTWKAGETIIAEGAVAGAFFFLLEGSARAFRTVNGQAREFAFEAAPTTIGHLSFFSGRPQPFSIVAASDTTAKSFTRSSFDRFVETDPEAALPVLDSIMRLLGDRVAREEALRRARIVPLPERKRS